MNEIGGIAVDGMITQGENIADNGGIKQAYRAYEKWLENHCQSKECIEQEHLQGLNVTNKQLFFINFAQVWCGAMRPEATKSKMKTAVHSPARYRVIGKQNYNHRQNKLSFPNEIFQLTEMHSIFFSPLGTLSNLREFSEAFECEADAPMNPSKKCSVW